MHNILNVNHTLQFFQSEFINSKYNHEQILKKVISYKHCIILLFCIVLLIMLLLCMKFLKTEIYASTNISKEFFQTIDTIINIISISVVLIVLYKSHKIIKFKYVIKLYALIFLLIYSTYIQNNKINIQYKKFNISIFIDMIIIYHCIYIIWLSMNVFHLQHIIKSNMYIYCGAVLAITLIMLYIFIMRNRHILKHLNKYSQYNLMTCATNIKLIYNISEIVRHIFYILIALYILANIKSKKYIFFFIVNIILSILLEYYMYIVYDHTIYTIIICMLYLMTIVYKIYKKSFDINNIINLNQI